MPPGCSVDFPDPHKLHEFRLRVAPPDGMWKGGAFVFTFSVPEDYNDAPPQVKCLTRLWHPNITEAGEVCLSLLRQQSPDGMGWRPTRRLIDVVWGVNSLFTDLVNWEDPLNIAAAEQYARDRDGFMRKVKQYIAAAKTRH